MAGQGTENNNRSVRESLNRLLDFNENVLIERLAKAEKAIEKNNDAAVTRDDELFDRMRGVESSIEVENEWRENLKGEIRDMKIYAAGFGKTINDIRSRTTYAMIGLAITAIGLGINIVLAFIPKGGGS